MGDYLWDTGVSGDEGPLHFSMDKLYNLQNLMYKKTWIYWGEYNFDSYFENVTWKTDIIKFYNSTVQKKETEKANWGQ